MTLEPKYVISKTDEVFIFPQSVSHDCLLKIFDHKNIRSAGFFRIQGNGTVICFGRSSSLDIENRDNDAILIELTLRIGRFRNT